MTAATPITFRGVSVAMWSKRFTPKDHLNISVSITIFLHCVPSFLVIGQHHVSVSTESLHRIRHRRNSTIMTSPCWLFRRHPFEPSFPFTDGIASQISEKTPPSTFTKAFIWGFFAQSSRHSASFYIDAGKPITCWRQLSLPGWSARNMSSVFNKFNGDPFGFRAI